jgi:hypothetical protein
LNNFTTSSIKFPRIRVEFISGDLPFQMDRSDRYLIF